MAISDRSAMIFLLSRMMTAAGSAMVSSKAASPTAATTSVLATQFNHDEAIGAGTVVVTTICSIVTLTVFAMLLPLLG